MAYSLRAQIESALTSAELPSRRNSDAPPFILTRFAGADPDDLTHVGTMCNVFCCVAELHDPEDLTRRTVVALQAAGFGVAGVDGAGSLQPPGSQKRYDCGIIQVVGVSIDQ